VGVGVAFADFCGLGFKAIEVFVAGVRGFDVVAVRFDVAAFVVAVVARGAAFDWLLAELPDDATPAPTRSPTTTKNRPRRYRNLTKKLA
jgi:hypothetical protein